MILEMLKKPKDGRNEDFFVLFCIAFFSLSKNNLGKQNKAKQYKCTRVQFFLPDNFLFLLSGLK